MIRKTLLRFVFTLLPLSSVLAAAPAIHIPAVSAESKDLPVPGNLRIPFGWPSIGIAPAGDPAPTILKWSAKELPPGETVRLRVSSALDLREKTTLELRFPDEAEPFGKFDYNFAPVFQIAEIILTRAQAERVLAEGILITRTEGKVPFHLFAPATEGKTIPALLQPHFMVAGETDRWAEFMTRMQGLDTIQTFGWMEGSLLDGLWALDKVFPDRKFSNSLSERLDLYLPGENLDYDTPKSAPILNKISGIEDTLPFASIARTRPDHPSIGIAIDFWKKHRRTSGSDEGSIQDGGTCSAEGSYTIGYPLMVIGAQRKDKELIALSLEQFRIRKKLLVDEDGGIWLRNSGGKMHMKNWARGVTWYFLGLVRGIAEAPEGTDTADLRAEAMRTMEFVLKHQQPDGLWRNLFDKPDQVVDTSGSAGIAAALAIGADEGILPEKAREAALKAKTGLEAHLTADGLLAHGTPSNRSPEAQTNKRVIFPVGMGLAAQLLAALEE